MQAALAVADAFARHGEHALLALRVELGHVGLGRDVVDVRVADDDLGKARSVGNALDHGGGAAVRVARAVHARDVRLERGTLALHLNAVCGHQLSVDLLADGGDDHVAGDGELLAGLDGATSAGLVGLAEDHLVAQQLAAALLVRRDVNPVDRAVFLLDGRGQLDEFDALVDGELELVLVGGHELLRAAVEDGRMRTHALCNARGVHGGVARADNDDVAA